MVSKKTLNIGMIGAGYIGQIGHLMNLVELENCRIVALADYRAELRQRVADRYSIPRTYASHLELLRYPDVDAVVVVVPREHLGPVVLDCLKAGKHVLSEKPMAGTVNQGDQLVDAAHASDVHYAVGYMKRYDEGVQAAKSMLDALICSGELGPVTFVRAHCYMGESYCNADGHITTSEEVEYGDGGWPVAPDWVPKENIRDFAAYVNTYSHNTNLLRYLFDSMPTAEYVHFSRQAARLAVLDFGPFLASLETGRSSYRFWDETTDIFFHDGRLRIVTPPALLRNVPATVELYKAGEVQEITLPQCQWSWAFRRQAEAFVNDVLSGQPSVNSGADALLDLRLAEEMWGLHAAGISGTSRTI